VGDQGAIDREDWALFRDTGVAHLMSISGLHVTMFAWLASLAVGFAWRRSVPLALVLPSQQAARWGGLVAATGYAVLSGWGVPAQRTVWMLAAVTVLRALGLRWPWPLVLLVAAAAVVAIDPWALLQPGFWLSFAAVGLLMAGSPRGPIARVATAPLDGSWAGGSSVVEAGSPGLLGRAAGRARSIATDALRTQVVATVGLAPLTLLFFNQISPVGFVANLVAIPVVTLLVTPLALAGLLVAPLWSLGARVAGGLADALAWLVAVAGGAWTVPAAPLWAQLAGLAGGLLVVLRLPWRLRLMGVALMLPLALPPRDVPPEGAFELVAIDVGQGLATLVRTHSHVLLFDAGPQYLRAGDAGERVVVPLLRALGAARVDTLVLSHRDLDHVGGARAVLGSLRVDGLSASIEPWHPLRTLIATHGRCEAGQRWAWDGVVFEVLAPAAGAYDRPTRSNALSCVLRIAGGGRSALLTGDIGRDEEAGLVAAHGGGLRSDVLVVPHHGSNTSSSAPFLDAVSPRVGLVSAGYRNRFGHPTRDVVGRHAARGVRVVSSASCGAWTWRSWDDPAGICHRDATRRAWRHPDRSGG
jgi:competence protein ComEC